MAKETKKQIFILAVMSLTAAIGGLLFGYDTGVISGAILFIRKEYALTTAEEAWIVSIVALGAMLGALIAGPLSDRLGRKKIVLTASGLFVLSAIGLAYSPSVAWIIFGRLLVGFAIGIASATAPLYIAELSPRFIRGALVSLNQLAITIGILVSYLTGLALASSGSWRLMFGLAAIPASLQFLLMLCFPESPRWLTINGLNEKAIEVLTKYRGSVDDAKLEVEHIQRINQIKSASWREFLSSSARKALLAGIGLTVIQQITGINTIIYFAPTIFQFAGFKSNEAAIFATTLVGVVNVLMTFVAIYLLDRIGRKPLLITGLIGMSLSLFILGFGFFHAKNSELIAVISIVSLMAYIAFFAYSLGPIAWLINSEIYPVKLRGRAMGIATCSNWISNFIVTLTFLPLISSIGKTHTFWLYGMIGLLSLWFIIKKIPETKGKSLEEIEEFWI